MDDLSKLTQFQSSSGGHSRGNVENTSFDIVKNKKYTDRSSELLENNVFNDYSGNKNISDYKKHLEIGNVPDNIRNLILKAVEEDKQTGFFVDKGFSKHNINVSRLSEKDEKYYSILKAIVDYGKAKYSEGVESSNFTEKDVISNSVGFDSYAVAIAKAFSNGVRKWTFIKGIPYPSETFGLNQKEANIEGSANTDSIQKFAVDLSGTSEAISSLVRPSLVFGIEKPTGIRAESKEAIAYVKNNAVTSKTPGSRDCEIINKLLELRCKVSNDFEANTQYDDTINAYMSTIESKIGDDKYCGEFFRSLKQNQYARKYFTEIEGLTDEDIELLSSAEPFVQDDKDNKGIKAIEEHFNREIFGN